MFTNVHHGTYLVEDTNEMANYPENNFDLNHSTRGEHPVRKYIIYHIGPAIMDFFEPTTPDSSIARQLKDSGPGVAHVAWGVDEIDKVFKKLNPNGN